MIKLKTYSINNNLTLTSEILVNYINQFWIDIFNNIKDTKHLMLMCKVQFTDESQGYRTLGHLRKVNFEDKELFIDYLSQRLGILNDSYMVHSISNITFSYIIKDGKCNESNRALLQDMSEKVSTTHNFNNMNLPVSMNPSDYGTILVNNYVQVDGETLHRFIVSNGSRTYRIDISEDKTVNHVTILGSIDLSWVDTRVNESNSDLEIFKREIKKSTIYFIDGEVVLRKQMLNAKPISKLSQDKKLVSDFITMDIETIKDANGKFTPYLICAYNGSDYITSFSKNQKDLFANFFKQLLSSINPGITYVYAHNLSGFDGIFLLRHLLAFGKVEPLLFNGKLMSIKVKVLGSNKLENKTIIFKDSYLLLRFSLRNLCEAFSVSVSKGYFPFDLSNINYTGVFPQFEYWTGISQATYDSIKGVFGKRMWSFKDEAIKYCKLDCKSLHDVLTKFSKLIFSNFSVNIHKVLTLPALAMKIYRIHFMPKNSIYQLLGKPDWNIRTSYTGGAVDVYKPHNRISGLFSNIKESFKQLYYYDVNSLYPYVMANFNMPIGRPVVFEGDIRRIDANAYGFFYCKITSPDNLEHPILQRRIKTASGIRTIAGLGTWSGWISSLEMDNAIKFGYIIEILKGYQFEQGDLFSGYVNKMYALRLEYSKGHPMNLIAKLLMNSLYGKFGMKLETSEIDIYDCSTDEGKSLFSAMLEIHGETLQDYVQIDNHYVIIRNTSLTYKYNEEQDMYHGLDVNIAVASSITAGARVHMSIFKNNQDYNIYYSDTDSAVIDAPLDASLVGNALGQMKLEHTINKAVFLAPKVYGLVDTDGMEVIKVKGISYEVAQELHISDLELLLVKDSSREFNQEKWFKKIVEGEISVADVAYTLKVTSNKRSPVYINVDGIEVYNSTTPFYYDEVISNK